MGRFRQDADSGGCYVEVVAPGEGLREDLGSRITRQVCLGGVRLTASLGVWVGTMRPKLEMTL